MNNLFGRTERFFYSVIDFIYEYPFTCGCSAIVILIVLIIVSLTGLTILAGGL